MVHANISKLILYNILKSKPKVVHETYLYNALIDSLNMKIIYIMYLDREKINNSKVGHEVYLRRYNLSTLWPLCHG